MSRPDLTNSWPTIWLSSSSHQSAFGYALMSPRPSHLGQCSAPWPSPNTWRRTVFLHELREQLRFDAVTRFLDLRQNVDFLSPINVIWPVQCPSQKYSASRLTQITSLIPAIPPHRGALRTSRTRGGMRWTRAARFDETCRRGRRSRVVLTSRRRRQVCEKKRRRRRQESPISGEQLC